MAPLLRNALRYAAVAAILCGASKAVAIERIFPLKVGDSHRLDFERRTPDGRRAATQVEYKVAGVDRTTITGCVYEVFKVERRESVGKRPLQFVSTEWYAADIRMIVGREYKRKKGDLEYLQFFKYDAIVSMKERKEN